MQLQQRLAIYNTLKDKFTSGELDQLLFTMGIKPGSIQGDTIEDRVMHAFIYVENRGRMEELIAAIRAFRPGVL